MKRYYFTIIYGLIIIASSSMVIIPNDDYKVAVGHSIAFKSADPSGKFKTISGEVSYSSANPTSSKFNLRIPVNSINTGNGLMNKKAMTKEWFDQATYPEIKFKSTSVTKDSKGVLQIKGTLSLKGISKEYIIAASVSGNASKYVFKGTFYVDRLSFKVGKKSETVPDKMKIIYELPVSK